MMRYRDVVVAPEVNGTAHSFWSFRNDRASYVRIVALGLVFDPLRIRDPEDTRLVLEVGGNRMLERDLTFDLAQHPNGVIFIALVDNMLLESGAYASGSVPPGFRVTLRVEEPAT